MREEVQEMPTQILMTNGRYGLHEKPVNEPSDQRERNYDQRRLDLNHGFNGTERNPGLSRFRVHSIPLDKKKVQAVVVQAVVVQAIVADGKGCRWSSATGVLARR